jgi:hypothetical protein
VSRPTGAQGPGLTIEQITATAIDRYRSLGYNTDENCLAAMLIDVTNAWRAAVTQVDKNEPDWIRAHGDDLIPVKLIDLLTVVPRLRRYLPTQALEEL